MADFNLIRENIQLLRPEFMSNYSSSTPINVLWNKFTDICDHCLKLIPTKTASSKSHHPWITAYIKRLTHKKQCAYNRTKQKNHPENWSTYFEIKRLTQQECCKTFNNYISSFIDSENNCTKKLWSFIKSRRLDQTGIGPINYKGETHTDSLSKVMFLQIILHRFTCKMIHLKSLLLKESHFLKSIQSISTLRELLSYFIT